MYYPFEIAQWEETMNLFIIILYGLALGGIFLAAKWLWRQAVEAARLQCPRCLHPLFQNVVLYENMWIPHAVIRQWECHHCSCVIIQDIHL